MACVNTKDGNFKKLTSKYNATSGTVENAIKIYMDKNGLETYDSTSQDFINHMDSYFKLRSNNVFTSKSEYNRAHKVWEALNPAYNSSDEGKMKDIYSKLVERFGEENVIIYETPTGEYTVRAAEPMFGDGITSDKELLEEMSDILSKAPRDKNGNLLAPNGKKSNLTERQYAQVRTKAFKDWFGDWENDPENASKVVDENGEPLVVYHATNKIFNTYKERDGIHFGSYNTALGVANEKFDPTFDTIEEAQASIAKGKFRIDQVFLNIRNPKQSKDLGTGWKQLITEGFDGGLYRAVEGDTSFVVFNPNQIKSATDNNGEFSKQDNNIYNNIQDETEYYNDAREYADELEKKYLSINYLNLSKERKEALKRKVREEFSKKFKHYRITFYYPKDNKSKHLKTYVKNNDEHDLTEWGKVLFGEASTDNNYSDDYDSGEVAKMILREVRGTSVHEMLIGELIAKALKQYNIIFAFSKTLDQDVAAKYEVVHGTRIIYINTKAAFINTNNYKNRVTQTIMHEMLHAITEEAISRNDDLYKQIDRLRKQVIKALGNNAKDYGLCLLCK